MTKLEIKRIEITKSQKVNITTRNEKGVVFNHNNDTRYRNTH